MARSVARWHTAVPLPEWIRPQLIQLVDNPVDGPDWLHEIKYDGYPCTSGSIADRKNLAGPLTETNRQQPCRPRDEKNGLLDGLD
jgi:hypothetical protein